MLLKPVFLFYSWGTVTQVSACIGSSNASQSECSHSQKCLEATFRNCASAGGSLNWSFSLPFVLFPLDLTCCFSLRLGMTTPELLQTFRKQGHFTLNLVTQLEGFPFHISCLCKSFWLNSNSFFLCMFLLCSRQE